MEKDYLKDLSSIVDEIEAETAGEAKAVRDPEEKIRALTKDAVDKDFLDGISKLEAPREDKLKTQKHAHYGHRARVKKSADTDPDFTTFSDIEMLEYLLFNTIPRINTNEIAHTLIDTFGSFSGVLNANVNELKTVDYINEETARMLTGILPAARKSEVSRVSSNVSLKNASDAIGHLAPYFMNRGVECVYMASLNNSDRVLSVDLVSLGDTNFSPVEVKRIIETACRHKATKVLLAHNHPSGNLKPSQEDMDVTARLVIALLSINVILVDHIVFTSDQYYSFFANRDFESIYQYADQVFNTKLVKELELKRQNYRAGIYPSGYDDEVSEAETDTPAYSSEPARVAYTVGHPNPRHFKVRE